MENGNQEKFTELLMEQLFYYYNATDIPLQLTDASGTVLQSFLREYHYCGLTREACGKRAFCERLHEEGCLQARGMKQGYIFSCPAGLIHFAISVKLKDMEYSILAGPLAVDYPDISVVDNLIQQCGCSINYRKKLYGALSGVDIVEPVRLQYLCQLLYSMLTNLVKTVELELLIDQKELEEEKTQHLSPILKNAVRYMELHYRENLRLDDVANHVGLNASYFSSVFKKGLSISFSQYLMQLRIEEACRLLRQTDRTLVEIALSLGFENQSYFSKSFKKHKGMSPNQYRREYK